LVLAFTKVDRGAGGAAIDDTSLRISALSGDGLAELRTAIVERLGALGVTIPRYGTAPLEEAATR
jgi:hypothetical protein